MSGPDATDRCSSRVRDRWWSRAKVALVLLGASAVGCSSAADQAAGPSIDDGAYQPPDTGAVSSAGAEDGSEGGDEGSAGSSGGGDPTDGSGETGEGEPLPPPPGDDDGTFAGCPAALPEGWVFCEDFEVIADPREVVLDYQDGGGAFVLVDGIGASGSRSMEVSYRPNLEGSGWMVLSFGATPIAIDGRPTYAPEASFQEVYWRMRVKSEPGWPDLGPGQLTRTVSFASDDWSEAVVAHLRSAGSDVYMEAVPVTCVSGTDVACAGYDDEASLEPLGAMVGPTPIFSEALSGQWHCVEGHLRLNTLGAADGALELWIDDELQASRSDLDLRGSWDAYGINALVIENLWPGGAPLPLRRWIDDVVISSAPIGCGGDPQDTASG
jgi:hypothetical protein